MRKSLVEEAWTKSRESQIEMAAASADVEMTVLLKTLDFNAASAALPFSQWVIKEYLDGERNGPIRGFARMFAAQGKRLRFVLEDLPPLDSEDSDPQN